MARNPKDKAISKAPSEGLYQSRHRIRIVTAAALFDGHDAAINVMRRILQASGAEVIHLGHNRSVLEIVTAAVQEDVQAVAISSYQGGHNEFYRYLLDELKARGADHIRVFGGGGGVIIPEEIEALHAYGVSRIYSPEDGRQMGLQGMINDLLGQADFDITPKNLKVDMARARKSDLELARYMTLAENSKLPKDFRVPAKKSPVLGVTGTGGAGKSSLVDEFLQRYLRAYPDERVCVVSIDPSKRKTGGALLGDRIRMNSVYHPAVFMRSLATRGSSSELGDAIRDVLKVAQAAEFELIIVESSGIGQADTGIVDICDLPIYVMTADFGAPSQLEKIDMLDFAQAVAINKFDRRGSEDALREVRRQYRRLRQELMPKDLEEMPVFGTTASRFNDDGVTEFYRFIVKKLGKKPSDNLALVAGKLVPKDIIIPEARLRYLSEVSDNVRAYHEESRHFEDLARRAQALAVAAHEIKEDAAATTLEKKGAVLARELPDDLYAKLKNWDAIDKEYRADTKELKVGDKVVKHALSYLTLSGTRIPRIAFPRSRDWGTLTRFLRAENLPGHFPFTAGVFPFRRTDEEPRRQFAGEGGPERTNRRFHYLCRNDQAKRLSTAFDSVTLYGMDPDLRPDIYGKIGESGVSICTLEDMKVLYRGFDLIDPNTSVSMTINGPAPMLLAMFLNTAIDQVCDRARQEKGGNVTGEERMRIVGETLKKVRGTVQADILKEDQAQNTCIFSTEFALRMMGDIQQYFSQQGVRYFYSVSISGYHIAEAGANPISQLAFTLANGFTYVEYYLARGLKIDDFAHNLSFFFSNGLDAEYSVMGRVARRIWAIAMKRIYGANDRSQKLKYHIQTSGRSLHAQEIDFNDIRTTLQALMAIYDNCNSLHTNAFDEAITTPTEGSVRRAMAIQMIVMRELGLTRCDNPIQGAYIVDELTDLVEEAVLSEFDRISRRGGVLGAMETQYQRSKIQEESLLYERLKHSGELPIVGVNTFVNPESVRPKRIELARSNDEEKKQRLVDLQDFQKRFHKESPAALRRLQEVATAGGNIFAELMDTVQVASLGQITAALFEVGGQFRRSM